MTEIDYVKIFNKIVFTSLFYKYKIKKPNTIPAWLLYQ